MCRDSPTLPSLCAAAPDISGACCTGYLGDIGVPLDPEPMDYSAWFEVYLGDRWYTFDARPGKPRIGAS